MVLGILQLLRMPVDVLPETSVVVDIQTEAAGLSAPEVESLVTVPLEKNLLEGVLGLPAAARPRSASPAGVARSREAASPPVTPATPAGLRGCPRQPCISFGPSETIKWPRKGPKLMHSRARRRPRRAQPMMRVAPAAQSFWRCLLPPLQPLTVLARRLATTSYRLRGDNSGISGAKAVIADRKLSRGSIKRARGAGRKSAGCGEARSGSETFLAWSGTIPWLPWPGRPCRARHARPARTGGQSCPLRDRTAVARCSACLPPPRLTITI
jgi:hypothetical protein